MLKMETSPQCAICGTTQQLLRCAKCKMIFYCSIAHQHMDWPTHKQACRLLAKQKNNIRMQQLQEAVSATSLNNSPTPMMSSASGDIDVVHPSWPMTQNGVGDIGFGFINGSSSAEVDPSILTMVPPMAVNMGNNGNQRMNNQVNRMQVDANTVKSVQLNHTGAIGTDSSNVVNNGEDTIPGQPPQYHNVDQRLLSPKYHQHQQQLMQQQLRCQQMPTPSPPPYAQTSLAKNQSAQHQYEKSFSCQIGSGGGVDENAFGNANERRYDELCRNIINDMNQYGLSVVDDFLGVEKGLQILNEVHRMYSTGVFKDGQLVNNLRDEELHTIRGDKIMWVKGVEPGCANVGYLINQIDAVICRANTMKNNGQLGNYNIKERTKAMVACYPGSGSQYVVHVDNPNKDGRVITAIYYLNVNWDTKRSGGVLRIFPEHGNSVADIDPKFDRLIFFWSDKRNPHEVQPSHRTRYAVTVWYFDADERERALNRVKSSKNITTATTSNTSTNTNATITTPANSHDHPNMNANQKTTNTTNVSAALTTTATTTPTPTNTNINMVTNGHTNVKTNANSQATLNTRLRTSVNTITNMNANRSSNVVIANSSEICT